MTTDHDKLRELAEAHVGVSDVELAPDVILSLLDALKAATERAERAERELAEMTERASAAEASWDGLRDAVLAEASGLEPLINPHIVPYVLRQQRDEARAERDARPEITAEDAASALAASGQFADPDNVMDEWGPLMRALRAHAAKVTR